MIAGKTRLTCLCGDITKQRADVIVNAANTTLLGGGGVDGAIHRAGGSTILEECRAIRARQGGCKTGAAVITTGGRLPARHVVHTVGPVWQGGEKRESDLLASCYRSSLELAQAAGARSIAFPSICTGTFGYPIQRAASIAISTASAWAVEHHGFEEIRFVLFDQHDHEIYLKLLGEQSE